MMTSSILTLRHPLPRKLMKRYRCSKTPVAYVGLRTGGDWATFFVFRRDITAIRCPMGNSPSATSIRRTAQWGWPGPVSCHLVAGGKYSGSVY
jgi:hypothetical protein